jgi:hypothetical protein
VERIADEGLLVLGSTARELLDALSAERAKSGRFLSILRALEWSAEGVTCPYCEGGAYRYGHLPNCALEAALKESK